MVYFFVFLHSRFPLLCLCFPGWWRGSFNMSAIINLCPPLAFSYSLMHVQNPHCMLGIHDQYLRMIYLSRWMSCLDDTLFLHQFFTHKLMTISGGKKVPEMHSIWQSWPGLQPGLSQGRFQQRLPLHQCLSGAMPIGREHPGWHGWKVNGKDEFFDFWRCYLVLFFSFLGEPPRDLIKRRE